MNADRQTVVPAKPSATVVMLRDGQHAPELLMVRRRAGDVFGDSYAFPGGLVDDDEPAAHEYCQGVTPDEANKLLHVSAGGLDFYSAAIRELFEETGILLALDNTGSWATDSPDLHGLRVAVDNGTLPWPQFLRDQGFYLPCQALGYFAHWETPLIMPRRFSARFFFAEMPVEQDVRHDGSELTESRWISATEALSLSREGTMKLPFPTIRTLQLFSELDSVESLLAWGNERALAGVHKVRPARIMKDDKPTWSIPGDPDYPGE